MNRYVLLLLCVAGCSKPENRVVLYCAQDREFAEAILKQFAEQSKIGVAEKYDTEANKSVSLYQELVREADRPRCDLFWNNEILSTIRLQKRGLLEPYSSPSAGDYPAWSKASDGTWQAFAARARVLIVNTRLVPPDQRPRSLFDLLDGRWKEKLVMAKPQFGTTATQAACLFEVLGAEGCHDLYRGLKANQIKLVAGNKQVAEEVGAGRFAVGLTDQDDAILEMEAGHPVEIIFPDREGHSKHARVGVLLIPNTLALIKGGPNPTGGKKLIDHLLSAETEKRLAEGGGYQIPLNPKVEFKAHAALQGLKGIKPMEVDWETAAEKWDEVQAFLRDEFGK
jgi:iron(III) transport system substrate-binding protein